MPESTFFGVDLSAAAIDDAQAAIDTLGLRNIVVVARDIIKLADGFAQFDYILCHGVFSWVPAPVRERILRLCATCLSENGVAYISYNVLPGWHLFNIGRDILRVHGERFEAPLDQVNQGVSFVNFLAGHLEAAGGAYGKALKMNLDFLKEQATNYVYHDFLSPVNAPCLFRDFMVEAQPLQFLGEAEFGEMFISSLPEPLRTTLNQISSDILSNEQYIDLVRCRTFRRTLLCHPSIQLNREIQSRALHPLYVSRGTWPAGGIVAQIPLILEAGGITLTLHAPEAVAAFQVLNDLEEESIAYPDLVARANSSADDSGIASALIHAYTHGIVLLFPRQQRIQIQPSHTPTVDPWIRYQIAIGERRVVNLRHRTVALDRFDAEVLPFVDGTRSATDLEQVVLKHIQAGRLEFLVAQPEALTPEQVSDAIRRVVRSRLDTWGRSAFLLQFEGDASSL
jgi:methyltransferase-like protein